jgi:tRNA threonylcarbamoyladenosine biosynthesis protein TsaE
MQLKLRRGWPFIFAKIVICARIKTMNNNQRTKSNKSIFIANSAKQTQKLGEMLGKELRGGEIICLSGELGSGKTTFAQGVLKVLGAKGPWTSPTFVVMKHYRITHNAKPITREEKKKKSLRVTGCELREVYHIDAYRVKAQDILDLGWEEIIAGRNNVVIVEWAERMKRIVPKFAVWLKFKHIKDDTREVRVN